MEFGILADGLAFPEGPVALADGSVILVEIAAGSGHARQPDGSKTIVARSGGGPNGAAIGPDGKCWVCNNGGFEWLVENGRRRPFLQARIMPAAGSNGSISPRAASTASIVPPAKCR